MPINEFFQFIIYVLPGFISLEIYRAEYPAKKISDFSKVTWSIFYGVLIYIFVRVVDEFLLDNLFVSEEPQTLNLLLIGSLLIAGVLFGFIRIGVHKLRFHIAERWESWAWLNPEFQTVWQSVNNQGENPDWAIVYLTDGAIYRGYIKEWSFDPDKDVQEILLGEAARVEENLNEKYAITGQGIYIKTNVISRIEYVKSAEN